MSEPRASCVQKNQTSFYEMELMVAKSKEEFMNEYQKYDEQNAKKFFLQILAAIKNSIIDCHIDNLKRLNNVFDYVSCITKYQSIAKDFLKITNLIVLACKENQVCVLQYLFSNDNNLLKNLSAYSGITISPDDEDETCHNAFYYAIRSSNIELLYTLLDWPDENNEKLFDTRLEDLDRIISSSYAELKLKNVKLTEEMEFLVENKLLNLRFYSINSEQDQKTYLDNIEKRIKLLLDNIKLLKNEYSNTSTDVDERFIFIAKSIAQNMQVLKWQLKFTYDRLPWEEIEFCLICFVSSHMKQQEINFFCLATLNKMKILYYLDSFAEVLNGINGEDFTKHLKYITEKHSAKNIGEEITIEDALAKLPESNREERLPVIMENKPQFCELYRNYQQIRDLYSLGKINKYIHLSLSTDPGEKHGQLIILRGLQVIGEHLKNTWESPKLSTETGDVILLSITKNTRKVIKEMRDSLSHAESLFKRTEIENTSDANIFTGIQNDMKRIGDVIAYTFSYKKLKIIKEILQKIVNSQSNSEIKENLEILSNAAANIFVNASDLVGKVISENFTTTIDQRLEKLLIELKDNIPERNGKEEELLNKIYTLMNSVKIKSESMKIYYRLGFQTFKFLNIIMDTKVDANVIRVIKYKVSKVLENMPEPMESDNLKNIAQHSLEIFQSVKSKKKFCNIDEITRIISQIMYISEFKTNDIQWIEELKEKIHLKKSESFKFIEGKYNTLLESKQRELQNILNSKSLSGDLIDNISYCRNNEKLQAILEMLILDIMSILLTHQKLEKNYLFLDEDYPILSGRCLRNHLAHENTFVALLMDSSISVLLNARKLTGNDIMSSSRTFGKLMKNDPSKLSEKYEKGLQIITKQKEMFDALEEGNIENLKECCRKGADLNARNIHSWNVLHFAAKGKNLEALKFIHAQNSSANVKDVNCRSPLHIAAAYGRTNNAKYLIEEAYLNANEVDSSHNSPLHIAAQNGHKETVNMLLKHEGNAGNTYDFTPLYSAIRNNQVDIVKLLLEENGNIHSHESVGGFSPLHDASERGHLEIVKLLLEKNADVNAKSDRHYTPLQAAALNGHLDVVNFLILRGAGVNDEDIEGRTPVSYAVVNNHEEIVKVLLNHEGNPNIQDRVEKHTPLYIAAIYGYEGIVQMLLDYSANANVRIAREKTPLHAAASNGHFKVVLILIRRGAIVNSRSKDGFTPLHCAVIRGHENVTKLLIMKGAEIDATAINKCTPLYFAALEGHKDIVKLLTEKKAYINAKDIAQNSVLHTAAFDGNKEVIDILLRNKVDANGRNSHGITPMHLASCNGHKDVLDSLIKYQAKVNDRDIWGLTPLHMAAKEGKKDAVNILIQNNAEVNAKDMLYWTPLHFAVDYGYTEVVSILTQNGADVNASRNGYIPLIQLHLPLLSAIKNNYKEIVDILIAKGADVNGENGEPLRIAVIAGYSDIVTNLIKKNAQTDMKYIDDFNLLHFAAQHGHRKVVNILIEKRACVNAVTTNNLTPLYLAAQEGYECIVQILIEKGANVNMKSDTGFTPMHIAAERGLSNIVGILLCNKANRDAEDDKHRTPLQLAIKNGHFEVAKLFLQDKDQNINAKSNDEGTLLHIAAQGFNLETVKYLVKEGADINARYSSGFKPIHIGAREGFKDAVQFLLNNGSNINDIDDFRQTVLHNAAAKNQLEIVKYLVGKCADVNAKDVYGISPLHIAAELGNKDIIEILLKNGAAYDAVDNKGRKPLDKANDENVRRFLRAIDELFKAVRNNNHREIESCINENVVVDVKNHKREAPLHDAARRGFDKIADILLENNANPNVVSINGFTPLHYAAKFSSIKIVKSLLSHGAVFNIYSHNGKIPIDLSSDGIITNLLKIISELFEGIKKRDPRITKKLDNIKDIDTMRAIMCACNENYETLTILAIQENLPEVEQLKKVLQDGVSDMMNKASMLAENGKFQQSLDIFKRVFEKRKHILGINNPGTLEIERHIALVLYEQGSHREALSILENILLKQKTILGLNNQDTLKTESSVALVLHKLNRNEEAFDIFQKVYLKQKKILGPNHIDTSNTRLHMALVLTEQGRFEMDTPIITAVIEKESEILKLKNLRALEALENIATIKANLGMDEIALKHYEEVLEIKKKRFGIDHIYTIRTLQSIAQVYSNQKNYQKCLQAHHKVLKVQKAVLRSDHPETLKTQYNLLNALYIRGKHFEFFKVYNECFSKIKDYYGPYNPFVLEISDNMKVIECKFKIEGLKTSNIIKRRQDDFTSAANDGDTEVVLRLLKYGAHVNHKDHDGRIPIHYASMNGHNDVVNILLENETDVNDKDNNGWTPLHYAASNGHSNIVNMLLANGADVNQCTNKGNTPLHISALESNKELVKVFLQHVNRDKLEEFINAKTIFTGNTALHVASQKGSLGVVHILLSYGAVYDIENNECKKPLDLSSEKTVIAFLQLLEELFEGAEKGDEGIVEKLREVKTDIFLPIRNARNNARKTLIQVSITNKHRDLAQKIIKVLHK